ncbi:hypothetical protein GBZ48_30205 [Azospirillum melinis]|uniref:HNH nuclease domain-containing protein n=1 Tax=Azospirillum melinis TaxID=328839 RepID=A0ABX2KIT3_9PROT|nr:5-methylcytosine-specific restriction endonuclease McrA [Azospirillum melinis]NUB03497.1 hypothetical protein [Azospirillum melinis]
MNFDWSDLISAINALQDTPPTPGIDDAELQAQFRVQSALRKALLCVPNDRLKADQYPQYLRRVLGKPPSPDIIRLVEKAQRGGKVSDDLYRELEIRQNCRCACCGIVLSKNARPQVDHIHPVAFGGESAPGNYQLLCSKCNLGKKASLHWVMAAPFFSTREIKSTSVSARYCILAKYQGKCAADGCTSTARDEELFVDQIIPSQEGGRPIFDNLQVLCRHHHDQEINRLQIKASRAVSAATKYRGAKKFSF